MGKYLFLDPSDVLSAGEYTDGEKLCLNAEPDTRYAIITRRKEKEFMKNQKENLFVCKNTGVTEEIADLIIEMFNGIAFY